MIDNDRKRLSLIIKSGEKIREGNKLKAEKMEQKAIEVCPLCGSKLDCGYLAFASGMAWSNKKISNWSLKGLFSGELIVGKGLGPHIYNVIAYRCRKCNFIILRYGKAGDPAEGLL
ncbi:MAG: PF20097 family protein [Candidatus Bathyarchaeia archaeon]